MIITTIFILTSCNGQQSGAKKQTEKNKPASKENRPGSMPTSESTWMLKAKIDGKEWIADAMMPPNIAGRIIGYYNKEYIGLPYNKQYLRAGRKISLGEDEAADIFFTGVGLATTKKGEMEITKVDGKWAEGKFFVIGTINGSGKSIEITDGFFRISLDAQDK